MATSVSLWSSAFALTPVALLCPSTVTLPPTFIFEVPKGVALSILVVSIPVTFPAPVTVKSPV